MPDDHSYLHVRLETELLVLEDALLPLIWPPEDPQEVEYWSGSLRMGELGEDRIGFSDVERTGVAVGALTPRRFACCGAPVESAAGRTVWALRQGREPVFPGLRRLVLGLDGIGAAAEVPDDLRGATLHLEQVAYLQPNIHGDVRYCPGDGAAAPGRGGCGRGRAARIGHGRLSRLGAVRGEPVVVSGRTYRVRLTGPDRAVLTAVDPVSVPRAGPETDPKYGAGDVVAIRLRFDEPVAVIGAPTLTFGLGLDDRSAAVRLRRRDRGARVRVRGAGDRQRRRRHRRRGVSGRADVRRRRRDRVGGEGAGRRLRRLRPAGLARRQESTAAWPGSPPAACRCWIRRSPRERAWRG